MQTSVQPLRSRRWLRTSITLVSGLYLVAMALACGGLSEDEDDDTTAGVEVTESFFGTAVDGQGNVTRADRLVPDNTVYLQLLLRGRPTGTLTFETPYYDTSVVNTLDLSNTNGGSIFTVGETTKVWSSIQGNNGRLYQGNYETVVSYDGTEIGRYAFTVGPPDGAVPSAVRPGSTTGALDANSCATDQRNTFATTDVVYVSVPCDIGRLSWLEARWYMNGTTLDAAGSRFVLPEENLSNTCFGAHYVPAGGWPVGTHAVALVLNQNEVARYSFTVQ